MKNTIDAHIDFSFKGENYDLSSTLDLDAVLDKYPDPSSLHTVLAIEHGIDTYSYLFDVMLVEEVRLDNPQGLATEFLHDGVFDFDGYSAQRSKSQALVALGIIAAQELGVEDLERQPHLKQALLRAYQLGMEA
ncbi:hypothetical protein [Ferriphaselus sp. R-1]|uniref:hypothetical protein n=1 Tax=Ferriphaselus sp. R-1 TaxID=1485544 RepID=UPI000554ED5F|nr:hypothetical protein [Ferriphaselus sp. R-1]